MDAWTDSVASSGIPADFLERVLFRWTDIFNGTGESKGRVDPALERPKTTAPGGG